MVYSDSDPGSPPPLESVLPPQDIRANLDFSSVSSCSALVKLRQMRKDEGAIEDQIRQLEKQLQRVKNEQSDLKNEAREQPPLKMGHGIGGPPTTSAKVVKKSKRARDKNLFRAKIPQYEPSLACPPHRCLERGNKSSGGGGGFVKSAASELDKLLFEIFDLTAIISTDRYLPVLVDVLRDEILEKLTPELFMLPDGNDMESSVKTIISGGLPIPGSNYAEYGTICPFLGELVPIVFAETLGQISGAMAKNKDCQSDLPFGDTCICKLSQHLPTLRQLRDRLAVTADGVLEQPLRGARSINVRSWVSWLETQHTLVRLTCADTTMFELNPTGRAWQRTVSKFFSFFQSEWAVEVARRDRIDLLEPMLGVFDWIGGIQLFEEAKRWRCESSAHAKTDAVLEVGGWKTLLEIPYFKTASLQLTEGSAAHTKEMADQLSRSDPQKAAQYYDTAALLSLPLFTARTNAALMRLRVETPRELERAISDCTTVLYFEHTNWKALNRRGRAYAALGYYRYALTDLEAAVSREPTNKDLKSERDRVKAIWDNLPAGKE